MITSRTFLFSFFRPKYSLLLVATAILPSLAQGQIPGMGGGASSAPKVYDGKITGAVLDSVSGAPVAYCTIALYEKANTKPVDGAVADEKGFFRLKNLKNSRYRLTVSFIGYETRTLDSLFITDKDPVVELGNLMLSPAVKLLKEAVVEGEKPLIEMKVDKLIYNADKDISSKGGNSQDVLRKVPMVSVDLEGNVMLQGTQNVRVLINDKPSSLMAASVADALKMIPADEIEKVEVITSPSAKYDAEGTGGIINIITKKKNIQGLSGSVNAGAGTRSSNLFSNLNFRQGRWGTGLNIGGFGYTGIGEIRNIRTTTSSAVSTYLLQTGDNRTYGFGPYAQLNSDVDLSSKSSLSGSFRLNNFNNGSRGKTANDFSFDGTNYSNVFTNDYSTVTNGLSFDGNIDYKKSFRKKEQELTLSAQSTTNNRLTDYEVSRLDYSESPYYEETSKNRNLNNEKTLQADYAQPVGKDFLMETGAKAIFRDVVSDYTYDTLDFSGDAFVEDQARSDRFDYRQDVIAGYAQGTYTVGKFGLKAGLRYELTTIEGVIRDADSSFTNRYDNFIPSGTVSYSKPGKYSMKVSYTQRIQRPGMTYLNPWVNTSDSLNITYGNPELEPETSHGFEFGFNTFRKFGSINASVYHRFTDNSIESIRTIQDEDIYVTTYDNIGKNYTTGMSLGINIMWQMKVFCGANANLSYYKVKTSGYLQGLSNDGLNYSFSIFGNYKFGKQWGVMVFGSFNGPKISVQGSSTSFWYYNASARREFKNGKGGIGVGLDNFASWYMHFRNSYSGEGFTYEGDNKFLFLGARVSLDYRFGKMEFSGPKKKGIRNDDLKDDGGGGGMEGGGMMGGGRK
jgi:outer membrane receptor protein involved in Fe transport